MKTVPEGLRDVGLVSARSTGASWFTAPPAGDLCSRQQPLSGTRRAHSKYVPEMPPKADGAAEGPVGVTGGERDALARLWPTGSALAREPTPLLLGGYETEVGVGTDAQAQDVHEERRQLLLRLLATLPPERLRLPAGVDLPEQLPSAHVHIPSILSALDSGAVVDLTAASLTRDVPPPAAASRTGALSPSLSVGVAALAAESGLSEEQLRTVAYEILLCLVRWEAPEAREPLKVVRAHLGISSRRHKALAAGLERPPRGDAATQEAGAAGPAPCAWGLSMARGPASERVPALSGKWSADGAGADEGEQGMEVAAKSVGVAVGDEPSVDFDRNATALVSWRLELLRQIRPRHFETDQAFYGWQVRQVAVLRAGLRSLLQHTEPALGAGERHLASRYGEMLEAMLDEVLDVSRPETGLHRARLSEGFPDARYAESLERLTTFLAAVVDFSRAALAGAIGGGTEEGATSGAEAAAPAPAGSHVAVAPPDSASISCPHVRATALGIPVDMPTASAAEALLAASPRATAAADPTDPSDPLSQLRLLPPLSTAVYCCLLGACFDADTPGEWVFNRAQIWPLLQAVRHGLHLGDALHSACVARAHAIELEKAVVGRASSVGMDNAARTGGATYDRRGGAKSATLLFDPNLSARLCAHVLATLPPDVTLASNWEARGEAARQWRRPVVRGAPQRTSAMVEAACQAVLAPVGTFVAALACEYHRFHGRTALLSLIIDVFVCLATLFPGLCSPDRGVEALLRASAPCAPGQKNRSSSAAAETPGFGEAHAGTDLLSDDDEDRNADGMADGNGEAEGQWRILPTGVPDELVIRETDAITPKAADLPLGCSLAETALRTGWLRDALTDSDDVMAAAVAAMDPGSPPVVPNVSGTGERQMWWHDLAAAGAHGTEEKVASSGTPMNCHCMMCDTEVIALYADCDPELVQERRLSNTPGAKANHAHGPKAHHRVHASVHVRVDDDASTEVDVDDRAVDAGGYAAPRTPPLLPRRVPRPLAPEQQRASSDKGTGNGDREYGDDAKWGASGAQALKQGPPPPQFSPEVLGLCRPRIAHELELRASASARRSLSSCTSTPPLPDGTPGEEGTRLPPIPSSAGGATARGCWDHSGSQWSVVTQGIVARAVCVGVHVQVLSTDMPTEKVDSSAMRLQPKTLRDSRCAVEALTPSQMHVQGCVTVAVRLTVATDGNDTSSLATPATTGSTATMGLSSQEHMLHMSRPVPSVLHACWPDQEVAAELKLGDDHCQCDSLASRSTHAGSDVSRAHPTEVKSSSRYVAAGEDAAVSAMPPSSDNASHGCSRLLGTPEELGAAGSTHEEEELVLVTFPERFGLAERYWHDVLVKDDAITEADRWLLESLRSQATGMAWDSPRPTVCDLEAEEMSQSEAMLKFVQIVSALRPHWWTFPHLDIVHSVHAELDAEDKHGLVTAVHPIGLLVEVQAPGANQMDYCPMADAEMSQQSSEPQDLATQASPVGTIREQAVANDQLHLVRVSSTPSLDGTDSAGRLSRGSSASVGGGGSSTHSMGSSVIGGITGGGSSLLAKMKSFSRGISAANAFKPNPSKAAGSGRSHHSSGGAAAISSKSLKGAKYTVANVNSVPALTPAAAAPTQALAPSAVANSCGDAKNECTHGALASTQVSPAEAPATAASEQMSEDALSVSDIVSSPAQRVFPVLAPAAAEAPTTLSSLSAPATEPMVCVPLSPETAFRHGPHIPARSSSFKLIGSGSRQVPCSAKSSAASSLLAGLERKLSRVLGSSAPSSRNDSRSSSVASLPTLAPKPGIKTNEMLVDTQAVEHTDTANADTTKNTRALEPGEAGTATPDVRQHAAPDPSRGQSASNHAQPPAADSLAVVPTCSVPQATVATAPALPPSRESALCPIAPQRESRVRRSTGKAATAARVRQVCSDAALLGDVINGLHGRVQKQLTLPLGRSGSDEVVDHESDNDISLSITARTTAFVLDREGSMLHADLDPLLLLAQQAGVAPPASTARAQIAPPAAATSGTLSMPAQPPAASVVPAISSSDADDKPQLSRSHPTAELETLRRLHLLQGLSEHLTSTAISRSLRDTLLVRQSLETLQGRRASVGGETLRSTPARADLHPASEDLGAGQPPQVPYCDQARGQPSAGDGLKGAAGTAPHMERESSASAVSGAAEPTDQVARRAAALRRALSSGASFGETQEDSPGVAEGHNAQAFLGVYQQEGLMPPSLLDMLERDADTKTEEEASAREVGDVGAFRSPPAGADDGAVTTSIESVIQGSALRSHGNVCCAIARAPAAVEPEPVMRPPDALDAATPRGMARLLVRSAVRHAASIAVARAMRYVLLHMQREAQPSTFDGSERQSYCYDTSGRGSCESTDLAQPSTPDGCLSTDAIAELCDICTGLVSKEGNDGPFADAISRYDPGASVAIARVFRAEIGSCIAKVPPGTRLADSGTIRMLQAATRFDGKAAAAFRCRQLAGVQPPPPLLRGAGVSSLFRTFLALQVDTFDACVHRALEMEDWCPVSTGLSDGLVCGQRFSGSVVDLFALLSQIVGALNLAPQNTDGRWLLALLERAVSAIFQYASALRGSVPDASTVVPPTPALEPAQRPRSLEEACLSIKHLEPSAEARLRIERIEEVIVRLNNLSAVVVRFIPELLRDVERGWLSLRRMMAELDPAGVAAAVAEARTAKLRQPASSSTQALSTLALLNASTPHSTHAPHVGAQDHWSDDDGELYPSTLDWGRVRKMFDGAQRTLLYFSRDLCDYVAYRIVFYDLRGYLTDGLYLPSAQKCSLRSGGGLRNIAAAKRMLLSEASSECAEQLMVALLSAAVAMLSRVLLDGGKFRIFDVADADVLAGDLEALEALFAGPGDEHLSVGVLKPEAVAQHTVYISEIVELYRRPTSELLNQYQQMYTAEADSQAWKELMGNKTSTEGPPSPSSEGAEKALAIFGVLCHRADDTARGFVEAQRLRLASRDDRVDASVLPMVESAGRKLHCKAISFNQKLSLIRESGAAALRKSTSGLLSTDAGTVLRASLPVTGVKCTASEHEPGNAQSVRTKRDSPTPIRSESSASLADVRRRRTTLS